MDISDHYTKENVENSKKGRIVKPIMNGCKPELNQCKPTVIDGKDTDFTQESSKYRILSNQQKGQVPGHYLKVDGHTLAANASRCDNKALFKITISAYNDPADQSAGDQDVYILESNVSGKVIAIENDKIVIKTPDKSPSQFSLWKNVSAKYPEMLFIHEPLSSGSSYNRFRLMGSPSTYLGFDSNGTPMTPSRVRPSQDEAIFFVHMERPCPTN